MESIKKSLKMIMNEGEMKNQYELLKSQLIHHDRIKEYLLAHPHITTDIIERSLPKLFEYKNELEHCDHCPGLGQCPNLMKGYRPELYLDRNRIELRYEPCGQKRKHEERKKQQSMIKSLYIPKEILHATFESIDKDDVRFNSIAKAFEYATTIKPGESAQGLYFYGKFGVGKTYLMGAIANTLADRNIETLLVYVPDFFRELKQAISDGSFNDKLDIVKNAPVLILDDIGAETMSSWTRDDVLGVILQHRMLERLPTLYTSNYDFDELEEHLSYSQKGGIEQLKAKRIMERIKHLTIPIQIDGSNRRVKGNEYF
ncbi:primosomal protein DnaI [Anaerobacillus sp. MEB173]|uniref:primosomal protein DnaI n=1 Tax=Anaerobacillus sp. MEB173 TaxID=3383345 RepID=UPI003F93E353